MPCPGQAFHISKELLEQKRKAAGTWVDDSDLPAVGVKSSASTRDPATIRGVQHRKCSAKQLREQYHHKRKKLQKMDEAWQKGQQYFSIKAWRALKNEVDELAVRSDEASWEKGEPFTDSRGVRRCEKAFEDASIVARAIDLYRKSTT